MVEGPLRRLKVSKINLKKPGPLEDNNDFFSKSEILVATATKEKSYTDASITLEFRLLKLILIIMGN